MKKTVTLILILLSAFFHTPYAQKDSVKLKEAMNQLNQALIQKKETDLLAVLHTNLSFGHSNGWVQNKNDVLNDLKTGKLTYRIMDNNQTAILQIHKKWATVKTHTRAEGEINGTPFQLNLHIMQVWLKTKKGWQLIARQSTKLS